MSADFWSGYVSGAVGILIGNPLDLLKVRQQATGQQAALLNPQFHTVRGLITGTAAPVAGYGALNALLFISYNRAEVFLNHIAGTSDSLWMTWIAGAVGGLGIWAISTPTELVKCQAQVTTPATSSWGIAKGIWRHHGLRGLYLGGTVTALRDSIGYGFYFWTYEALNLAWSHKWDSASDPPGSTWASAPQIVFCGGIAGIVTWASVFPLDVIKTRVQVQGVLSRGEGAGLLGQSSAPIVGAIQAAKTAYAQGGFRVFFAGLSVCSARAFMVNAVQWTVYEFMMNTLGQGRSRRLTSDLDALDLR